MLDSSDICVSSIVRIVSSELYSDTYMYIGSIVGIWVFDNGTSICHEFIQQRAQFSPLRGVGWHRT